MKPANPARFHARTFFLFTLLAMTIGTGRSALAQGLKIGYVQMDRITSESAIAQAATVKLEKEFSRRDKAKEELAVRLKKMTDRFEIDVPVLSPADRNKRQRELTDLDKEIQRLTREFREDLNHRRSEELAQISERVSKVIKEIAQREKFDLILQEALFASARVDITNKVLAILNQ